MNQAQLDTLTCPICLEYCQEAVSSSCCKTIYCRNCTIELANCSMCRAVCRFEDAFLARRLIDMIQVRCDCGYKCARVDLETHKKISCLKTHVKCPFEECNDKIQRGECYEHIRKLHFNRLKKAVKKKNYKEETINPYLVIFSVLISCIIALLFFK
jgi:hypothetical protein